jgi:hypothetical protein
MDPNSAAAAHSRATLITVVTIVFLSIAWLAVLARTWVRAVMIRNYGWDDAVMLLAMVRSHFVRDSYDLPANTMSLQLTYTIYAAFNLVLVSWGFGNSHLATQDIATISRTSSVRWSLPFAFLIYCHILGDFIPFDVCVNGDCGIGLGKLTRAPIRR